MKIDKDAELIAEAYKNVNEVKASPSHFSGTPVKPVGKFANSELNIKPGYDAIQNTIDHKLAAKSKIDSKELAAAKNRLRDGLNRLAKEKNASHISDVVYTLTQYPTFSPEANALRMDLEDELDSIQNDMELIAKWNKISELGDRLLKEEFEEQVEPSPREAAETTYGIDSEEAEEFKKTLEDYLQEFSEKVATKLSQENNPFNELVRSIKDFVRENGAEAPISKFIENI